MTITDTSTTVPAGEAASKGRHKAAQERAAKNAAKVEQMNERNATPNRKELIAKAQQLGVQATARMKKAELETAIAKAELNALTARNAEPEPEPAPTTQPEPEQAKAGRKSKYGPRGQEALAIKRAKGKRGRGRKVTDEELTEMLRKVRAEHPDTTFNDELEYHYWVEGIALSRDRVANLWRALDAEKKGSKVSA